MKKAILLFTLFTFTFSLSLQTYAQISLDTLNNSLIKYCVAPQERCNAADNATYTLVNNGTDSYCQCASKGGKPYIYNTKERICQEGAFSTWATFKTPGVFKQKLKPGYYNVILGGAGGGGGAGRHQQINGRGTSGTDGFAYRAEFTIPEGTYPEAIITVGRGGKGGSGRPPMHDGENGKSGGYSEIAIPLPLNVLNIKGMEMPEEFDIQASFSNGYSRIIALNGFGGVGGNSAGLFNEIMITIMSAALGGIPHIFILTFESLQKYSGVTGNAGKGGSGGPINNCYKDISWCWWWKLKCRKWWSCKWTCARPGHITVMDLFSHSCRDGGDGGHGFVILETATLGTDILPNPKITTVPDNQVVINKTTPSEIEETSEDIIVIEETGVLTPGRYQIEVSGAGGGGGAEAYLLEKDGSSTKKTHYMSGGNGTNGEKLIDVFVASEEYDYKLIVGEGGPKGVFNDSHSCTVNVTKTTEISEAFVFVKNEDGSTKLDADNNPITEKHITTKTQQTLNGVKTTTTITKKEDGTVVEEKTFTENVEADCVDSFYAKNTTEGAGGAGGESRLDIYSKDGTLVKSITALGGNAGSGAVTSMTKSLRKNGANAAPIESASNTNGSEKGVGGKKGSEPSDGKDGYIKVTRTNSYGVGEGVLPSGRYRISIAGAGGGESGNVTILEEPSYGHGSNGELAVIGETDLTLTKETPYSVRIGFGGLAGITTEKGGIESNGQKGGDTILTINGKNYTALGGNGGIAAKYAIITNKINEDKNNDGKGDPIPGLTKDLYGDGNHYLPFENPENYLVGDDGSYRTDDEGNYLYGSDKYEKKYLQDENGNFIYEQESITEAQDAIPYAEGEGSQGSQISLQKGDNGTIKIEKYR